MDDIPQFHASAGSAYLHQPDDGAAVRAALTLPWSNGQTEGQAIKVKLLKPSMYGRAKFDLLRQRLLLGTQQPHRPRKSQFQD